MEVKRKAMEGAIVPAKRARNEVVAFGDKENALVQSVCFSFSEFSGWGIASCQMSHRYITHMFHISSLRSQLVAEVAEWLAHWLLVLEVPGSNDMIQCAVLRIGTLTGGHLCRDSHPLCRFKIPTQVLSSCM